MLRSFATLALAFGLAATSTGCDSSDTPAAVDEVVVLGTNVDASFLDDGQFDILATPLSAQGAALLTDVNEVRVTVASSSPGARLTPGTFTISAGVQGTNAPSGNPLAVAISLDQSSSMGGTDPNRLRVDGARAFVDVLDSLGTGYEVGVFAFGATTFQDTSFASTDLLFDYTSIADSARAAIGRVGAFTGTPTYPSLIETLEYSERVRPTGQYERAVVLLSDGSPNGTSRRQEACDLATAMDSPVYAIGLGPASDLSPSPSPGAVEEMRSIAQCTGGSYAGISAAADGSVDLTSIRRIYESIAVGTARGSLTVGVTLSGEAFDALQPGDTITGELTLGTDGGSTSSSFAFTVPARAGAAAAWTPIFPDGAAQW